MTLTIALAQVNPIVGNVAGNTALVRRMRDEAAARGADLVVFSELVLVGYPPEDLVLRPALVEAAAAALRELVEESKGGGPGMLVTLPWHDGGGLHNSIALEMCAQMAIGTLALNPQLAAIPPHISEKHHERKHGANAYYGQKG